PRAAAVARHPYHRRGRWIDRSHRRRWGFGGRATQRGRVAGARVLRARRDGADGDRRRPGAGADLDCGGVPGTGRARRVRRGRRLAWARQGGLVRAWPRPGDRAGLANALAALAAEATKLLGGGDDVEVDTALDCRYAGQSHELRVAGVDGFPEEHRRRNGYVPDGAAIELVALRARAWRSPRLSISDLPPISTRHPAAGPCTVAEP